MFTSRPRLVASPVAARHSLRVRLPLLISVLLLAAVATFLGAAYREVEVSGGFRVTRAGVASQASFRKKP